MDTITLHRKARLKALIESPPFNGSQIDFAKAIGRSKGRVTQMLDPDQPFGEGAATAICHALGKPARYFEQGFKEDQQTIRDTVNLSSGISEIPLLDRKTAGMYKRFLEDGETPPALHNHPGKGANLFAYSVDDDLMEPLIPSNARAIISTRIKPKHGSLVLVDQDGVCVLRKLVIDGQTQLVETVKYQKIKPLTGTIIGVVHMVAILYAEQGDEE